MSVDVEGCDGARWEPHGGAWKQRNNGNNGTRDKVTNSQSNNGREETRLHATPQEATFFGP
jgi:hypothetical protein